MNWLWDIAPCIQKGKKVHFAVLEKHWFNFPLLQMVWNPSKWNYNKDSYFIPTFPLPPHFWCWTFCLSLNGLSSRVWKCPLDLVMYSVSAVWKLGLRGHACRSTLLPPALFFQLLEIGYAMKKHWRSRSLLFWCHLCSFSKKLLISLALKETSAWKGG